MFVSWGCLYILTGNLIFHGCLCKFIIFFFLAAAKWLIFGFWKWFEQKCVANCLHCFLLFPSYLWKSCVTMCVSTSAYPFVNMYIFSEAKSDAYTSNLIYIFSIHIFDLHKKQFSLFKLIICYVMQCNSFPVSGEIHIWYAFVSIYVLYTYVC